jgi:hypothetical protein
MFGCRGVTLEKQDTGMQSRKFRVLLVRKELIDELGDVSRKADGKFQDRELEALVTGQTKMQSDQQDSGNAERTAGQQTTEMQSEHHVANKRKRLLQLWTLKHLLDEEQKLLDGNQPVPQSGKLFLVGSVLLSTFVVGGAMPDGVAEQETMHLNQTPEPEQSRRSDDAHTSTPQTSPRPTRAGTNQKFRVRPPKVTIGSPNIRSV